VLGMKDAAFNGSFNGDIKSTLEKGQKVSFNENRRRNKKILKYEQHKKALI